MHLSLTAAHGLWLLLLLLQVRPQPQDDPAAHGDEGAENTAEGDGARVPGRAHEHVRHDGEWVAQGGRALRKGRQRQDFTRARLSKVNP